MRMEREIKFRGFDATGQKGWVYGDLAHNQKVTRTGLEPRTMVGGYEVVPESVGQFTGLKDNQGKDIYEGDLVNHPYIDPIFGHLVNCDNNEGVKSEVCFHDGSFVVKYDTDHFIYLDCFIRKNCLSVIGTIYEQNKK